MPRVYRLQLDVTSDGVLRAAAVTRYDQWGGQAEYVHVLAPGWVAEHEWAEVLDELMERAAYQEQPPFPGFDPPDEEF